MKKIAKKLTELIGNTPLLELNRIERINGIDAQIWAKLEYLNPARSVKDRIGLSLIEDAEEKGLLTKMATITVNGKKQDLENQITIATLIALNNITQPYMVSVQLNEEFISRKDDETIELKDGDKIDFLYFMGGGQSV